VPAWPASAYPAREWPALPEPARSPALPSWLATSLAWQQPAAGSVRADRRAGFEPPTVVRLYLCRRQPRASLRPARSRPVRSQRRAVVCPAVSAAGRRGKLPRGLHHPMFCAAAKKRIGAPSSSGSSSGACHHCRHPGKRRFAAGRSLNVGRQRTSGTNSFFSAITAHQTTPSNSAACPTCPRPCHMLLWRGVESGGGPGSTTLRARIQRAPAARIDLIGNPLGATGRPLLAVQRSEGAPSLEQPADARTARGSVRPQPGRMTTGLRGPAGAARKVERPSPGGVAAADTGVPQPSGAPVTRSDA